MEIDKREDREQNARGWTPPTLMVLDAKEGTRNFTNPALNNDSMTNYYTEIS